MSIIPAVHRELGPWLASNPDHPAAQAIRLRDRAVDLREYDTTTPEQTAAFTYYVRLLGFRKKLFRALAIKFEGEHGRLPTMEEEKRLRREANEKLGPRGYLFG